LPGIVFLSVGKILASDLAGRNRPEYGMWASLASLSLTVALDIVLIPRLGITGAGIVSSVAYAVTFIILLGWYVRMSGNGPVSVLVIRKSDLQTYAAVVGKVYSKVRRESSVWR
jgi:Na+-driven multidrug efflux pump